MKNIYVVLPRSETIVAKVARKITKYEYSHVTICLDDKLEKFYSFSRIYNNAPIISGFVSESRSDLASKEHVNLKCKIFKIPVKDKEYDDIKLYCKKIRNDEKLMFNYITMLLLSFKTGKEIYKAYNCCEFVATILSKYTNISLNKMEYKFSPEDFDKLLSKKYLYFDGFLSTNSSYKTNYFKKVPLVKNMIYSIRLIYEIIYRMIFKKTTKKFNNKKFYNIIKNN